MSGFEKARLRQPRIRKVGAMVTRETMNGYVKAEAEGVFVLGEHEYGDHVTLTLQYPGGEVTSEASDYFEAMCQIRNRLEADGWRPVCYGSSRNVYPSGMCRGMALGLKAYKMQ